MTQPLAVRGTGGLVVSPHRMATEVGVDVLDGGGNAVDAAIATNAVLGTVAPEMCGIGGDLFALIWRDGEVECLDAAGWAGLGADPEGLRRSGHTIMPNRDPQTVTIPGCVAGWYSLADRFGSRPIADLLHPAERLSADGFPSSTSLAEAVAARADDLLAQPHGSELFVDGLPPRAGANIERPTLARTLASIRHHGTAGFYSGPVAEEVSLATGRAITPADLESYRPEWVEPLSLEVFGLTGWTVPPPSQGYLTLAAARVLETLVPEPDPRDPQTLHLMIEAYRAVAADRDEVLSDRRFLPPDWTHQLDSEHLDRVAASIDPERARPFAELRQPPGGTAYLCALDRTGMAISLIQSNYSGIGAGIGAAGFFLHNRGAGFDLRPGHPNELAPGKRPLHTLSPTLWTRGERLEAVVGTRGGHQQPQILLTVLTGLLGAGMDGRAAIEGPRWITEHTSPESAIEVERSLPPATIEYLRSKGHAVRIRPERQPGWGPVSIISNDGTAGSGYSDPRVDSAAAGGPGATPISP